MVASNASSATGLVQIYEDLATEDGDTRLLAASSLLRYLQNDESQARAILQRLFRGLCSGRKAARLGFATALTEVLYQSGTRETDSSPPISSIIDLLEELSKPESGTSGQDERDHYFGRLFGIEAIMKSSILFMRPVSEQWDRLLDITCTLALQKPWLRQACGWVLYTCIKSMLGQSDLQSHAVRIVEKLSEHKLVRTPEGLAVWIEVRRLHPKAKLPKHVWKDKDPLSMQDLQTLADVLKDAKANTKNDEELVVQGSAMWVANLHFVWDIVLTELFGNTDGPRKKDSKPFGTLVDVQKSSSEDQKERVKQFWQVTVDQALFAPTNSKERKHWGFLVMQKTLDITPSHLAGTVFSKNAVDCLILSLKSDDRYLKRSALTVVQKFRQVLIREPGSVDEYVLMLLRAIDYTDFDHTTKTKMIDEALHLGQEQSLYRLAQGVGSDTEQVLVSKGPNILQRLRLHLNVSSRIIMVQVHKAQEMSSPSSVTAQIANAVISQYFEMTSQPSPLDESAKKLVLEKTQLALEQILKLGQAGRLLVIDLTQKASSFNPVDMLSTDPEIVKFINTGWKRLQILRDQIQTGNRYQDQGLALLYALILLEIYNGDTEAVQILRELLESEAESATKNAAVKRATLDNTDALVEILLSFAARPSKFLRRITMIIFEMFTPQITRNGLQSLTDVLETKETRAGQQELFEANEEHSLLGDSDEDGEEEDSDIEMLDSDVEVVNASSNDESGEDLSDSESDDHASESSDTDTDTEMQDAELLALETSLANALGTRKLTHADADSNSSASSSGSDSDMTDSEMMALDEKLSEVFRNRATSSSQTRKKEQRSAKENIVNFKNRVLDMLEIYIRKENLNPQTLDLILPLLHLSRHTNTKQLADRATKFLLIFTKRCSGLDRVPTLPAPPASSTTSKTSERKSKSKSKSKSTPDPSISAPTDETPLTVPDLHQLHYSIHAEALHQGISNSHVNACSKTSILVSKVLLKANVDIADLDTVYASTEREMTVGPQTKGEGHGEREGEGGATNAQKAFLDDWVNWRVSVRGRIGK